MVKFAGTYIGRIIFKVKIMRRVSLRGYMEKKEGQRKKRVREKLFY